MTKGGKPDVAVISAVYDLVEAGRADVFRQMVASVAAQTGVSLEHIVVDGGSEVGTPELIAEVAHPTLRWSAARDDGVYDAMNAGAAGAHARYLVISI